MVRQTSRLVLAGLVLMWLMACRSSISETVTPAVDVARPTTTPTTALAGTSRPTPPPPATPGRTANADVVDVRAVKEMGGDWTFHVTVRHPDMGWEDYADGWDVVAPDGSVLKPDPDSPFTRLLLHPHVDEQPFTRSQSGIRIRASTTQVRVRAHDLVDGWGGREVLVDLTIPSGPGFEVERNP